METLKSIRGRIEAAAKGKAPAQRRYPKRVRTDAVAYTRDRVSAGAKIAAVAKDLGLSDQTLRHWLETTPAPSAAIRPVAVVPKAAPSRPTPAPPRESQPVLVTPSGFRIEGLNPSAYFSRRMHARCSARSASTA